MAGLHWVNPVTCLHPRPVRRIYLGSSTAWYWFCPACFSTWPRRDAER